MSEPLQVRISRDGKEFATYSAQEAVRLLVYGTLKETDFYWHEGMTDWAPLTQLQASEARRQLAERALQQKQEEERKAAELAKKRREEADRLREEQVKTKEEEERLLQERVQAELARRKATWFRCHCCRESFAAPKTQGENLGCGAALILGSAIVLWITYSVAVDGYRSSPPGISFGAWVATVSFFLGLSLFTVAHLRSPCCPKCESTNYSKPEKTDDE